MLTRRQFQLAAIGAGLLIALVLFWTVDSDRERPRELQPAAEWLASHPADWIAASIISDTSLDSDLPRRFELWRDAHALADRLAPRRPNGAAAFVRAGLFHWFELGEADRRAVLAAAVPLLRDPKVFESMHEPLWELTRDLRLLRRANPGTSHSYFILRELAAKNGLFADYRSLREEYRRARLAELQARRAVGHPGELLGMLPVELQKRDEPLVRALLDELKHRPLETMHDSARIHALIDFAIRHRLPLDGLHALIRKPDLPAATRARMALAQGDHDYASQLELAHWAPGMHEWTAYQVERAFYEARRRDTIGAQLHLDRAKVPSAELEVRRILGAPLRAPAPRIAPVEIGKEASEHELFAATATTIPITVDVVQSDRIAPYVEILVDDALVVEGEVARTRTFEVPVASGLHHVEVRIANPLTRGHVQRRVRLS